jgi:uncharacterized membrane protein
MALVSSLLWVSAIGCGLVAGLFFAFSTFILQAFDRLGPERAAEAMNAINARIVRSLFMPLFLGTTLTSAALAAAGLSRAGAPGGGMMLAGGAIYAIGMFGVTMAFNVPLNNALAAARGADVARTWPHYFRRWTLWNHIRTLASTLGCALFIAAIAVD